MTEMPLKRRSGNRPSQDWTPERTIGSYIYDIDVLLRVLLKQTTQISCLFSKLTCAYPGDDGGVVHQESRAGLQVCEGLHDRDGLLGRI